MRTVVLAAIVLAVSGSGIHSQVSVEAEPVRVVKRYFDSVVARDVATALALCTTDQARRPGIEGITREVAAMGIAPNAEARTYYRTGDDAKAVVRLKTSWKVPNGRRVLALDFRLDREPGGWRLQAGRDAYDHVKSALVDAADPSARQDVVARNEELIDGTLAIQLRRDAEALSLDGKHDGALRTSDAAFAVAEHMKSAYELGYCCLTRGSAHKRNAQWNAALADFEAARKHFLKAGDKEGEGKTQSRAASVYARVGLPEKSITFYKNALRISREIRDEDAEANALQDVSTVLKDMARPAEALKWNSEARAIRARRSERTKEAVLIANEAALLADLGRHGQALVLFDQALTVLRDAKDLSGIGHALNNLANALEELGRRTEARDRYVEAGKVFREVKDLPGEWMALHNLAGLLARMGDTDGAIEKGLAAAKLGELVDERRYEAQSYGLLQQIMLDSKKYAEALALTEDRLEAARAVGNRLQTAAALVSAGFALVRLDRAAEARQRLDEARKLAEEIRSLVLLQQIWRCYGDLAARREDWQVACDAYGRAVTYIEQDRQEVREHSLMASFLRQHVPVYRSLIRSLVEAQRTPSAFAASERAKARSLTDLLQGGKIDLRRGMTGSQRARSDELENRIRSLAARMESAVSTDETDALRADLDNARKDLDEFRVTLYLQHPGLQTRRADFTPASLKEIASVLLPPGLGTALLSYTFTADRCFLFVIDRGRLGDPRLTLFTTAMSVDDLRAEAEAAWRGVASPTGSYHAVARSLYGRLLAPAAARLAGNKHLVIVPDGAAPPIPFAALIDERGRAVVERWSVSYAPSVTALVRMVRAARVRTRERARLLAVGAPRFPRAFSPLPATAEEVRRVAAAFGGRAGVLTGLSANRARVASEARDARYLHFATHGILDEQAPMQSAVVLSPGRDDDGLLRARDMADMSLRADLVVLSACQTALGQQLGGEGVLGLTWALFVGGATATLATQWQVADESTRALMVDFYQRLFPRGRRGTHVAEALRQAQLRVRKDPRYRHPYYWAPFVLNGCYMR